MLMHIWIVFSAVKLYIQERDFATVKYEMGNLIVILLISLIIKFQSPHNFKRFTSVLLDVPNIVLNRTVTIQTEKFSVLTNDKKSEQETVHVMNIIMR